MAFKLTLFEGEENEKILIAPRPKGRLFRKALVVTKEYDLLDLTPETLDELMGFVCEVFEGKTTIEELYDGYVSFDMAELVSKCINYAITGKTGEVEEDENDKKK